MPVFSYQAKTKSGKLIEEIIEAESNKALIEQLHRRELYPIKIEEAAYPAKKHRPSRINLKKISNRDLVVFARQLSDLILAGTSLTQAFSILIEQTANLKFKEVIKDIKNQIQDGNSFSQSLTKYPRLFSSLYISLIKTGEAGGDLEKVLTHISNLLEKQRELVSRLRSISAYPLVMLLVALGTIIFLITFVIPKFVIVFEDLGQILPLPTRILIAVSNFFHGWGGIISLALIFTAFIAFRQYSRTDEGRLQVDRLKLNLPLVGKIFRTLVISRFTLTVGNLIANGVPILRSLELSKETVRNEVMSREIEKIQNSVRDGKGLAFPLMQSKLFPPIVSNIIAVGEESGSLEKSLRQIASSYAQELENTLKTVTSLLEPAIILTMGVLIGFIVLAMLLPIFEITGALG